MSRLKYIWTPEMDEYLRDHYDTRVRRISFTIGERFGFPKHNVCVRARKLGLARTKEPMWTPKDTAMLEGMMATRSLKEIARRLGRTKIAVRLKAKRLGLAKSKEGYTARTLAQALGADAK